MASVPRSNAIWSRDELVLALDLYVSIKPRAPDPNSVSIIDLSDFLRKIAVRARQTVPDNYRSPASVVMKLMNFRSLDPDYEGKGLEAVAQAD